jgi:pyruvate,water dikinase
LQRLRNLVWLREELRDVSNTYYYALRRFVLEIARVRGLNDDIFMMTFQQILADDRRDIESNWLRYRGYRRFHPPNEIGSRYGHQPTVRTSTLCGVGASGGRAEGQVFVARDVHQAAAMPPGKVLVCPFTDPGWTPVLERAIAVVTETGGLLSHAAVICREFGMPAVLGVERATHRVRTGQEVVVWGDRGLVETAPNQIDKET